MRSRYLAVTAVLLAVCATAIVTSGCSQPAIPAPTVNGAAVEASAAAAAAAVAERGIDTTLSVTQLVAKLRAAGLKTTRPGSKRPGLFLPAKYEPLVVDASLVQTYRFKDTREARGAASTVDTDGAVLGATPTTLVNVPWTGKPGFFRSGRLVVIFVSQRPLAKHRKRDTRVFNALETIMGKPFAGTFGDSPAATSTATPQ